MPRETPLSPSEIDALVGWFPELAWIDAKGWQDIASYADWRGWIDAVGKLPAMLTERANRVKVRGDCRSYWGEDNVPNVNDPDDATWA